MTREWHHKCSPYWTDKLIITHCKVFHMSIDNISTLSMLSRFFFHWSHCNRIAFSVKDTCDEVLEFGQKMVLKLFTNTECELHVVLQGLHWARKLRFTTLDSKMKKWLTVYWLIHYVHMCSNFCLFQYAHSKCCMALV